MYKTRECTPDGDKRDGSVEKAVVRCGKLISRIVYILGGATKTVQQIYNVVLEKKSINFCFQGDIRSEGGIVPFIFSSGKRCVMIHHSKGHAVPPYNSTATDHSVLGRCEESGVVLRIQARSLNISLQKEIKGE